MSNIINVPCKFCGEPVSINNKVRLELASRKDGQRSGWKVDPPKRSVHRECKVLDLFKKVEADDKRYGDQPRPVPGLAKLGL